jgi:ArsR family transcriptional regulator
MTTPESLSARHPVIHLSDQTVTDLCHVFGLLCDETRLRILLHLAHDGELDVNTLCGRLHQSQPAVSHHLGLMRMAGIVEFRRDGKHNYYSVRPHLFQKLMAALTREKGVAQPCDQILECVLGPGAS